MYKVKVDGTGKENAKNKTNFTPKFGNSTEKQS
jgi:hypothetical protein